MFELRAAAARHLLPVLRVAGFPTARDSSSRNSSLFRQSFASLACTLASASAAISAGNVSPHSGDGQHAIDPFPPIQPLLGLLASNRPRIKRAIVFTNRLEQDIQAPPKYSDHHRAPLQNSVVGSPTLALDVRRFLPPLSLKPRSHSSILPSACRASSIPSQVKLSGAR